MTAVSDLIIDPSSWPEVRAYQPAQRGEDRQPPGGYSMGTTYLGGPLYTDPFQSKRAPAPWQLVEKYRSLIYAMVHKNFNAVARTPLRLYADGSKAQGGKPTRHCDPIRVTRSIGVHLARAGLASPSAVDQIYEVRTHPALDLLEKPDPYGYFTKTKLISLCVASCDVIGSFYLFPDWDGWDWRVKAKPNRMPEFLWVLYSQYVLPVRKAGTPLIDVFQYFMDRLPYETTLWFRQSTSLRDPYGSSYSPTYAGDQYAEQESRFIAIYDQVLGIGPRPNLIATAKDPLQPPGQDQRRRLEQDANRKHSGGMAGGLLVNDGAWEFTPVSYPPADLGGKEVSEYDVYRLAGIFGQPPTYHTVDSNLANLEAADHQHARDGVEPRCKMIAETLTQWVKQYDPKLFFSFDSALPEDEELKAKVIDMKLKNGSITINQANEETQWPKVEWGDEPWLAGTLKQPTMLTEAHQQGMESQKATMENQKTATEFQYGDDLDEESDSGDTDSGADKPSGNGKPPPRTFQGIHGKSIERRIDKLITALERDLGL